MGYEHERTRSSRVELRAGSRNRNRPSEVEYQRFQWMRSPAIWCGGISFTTQRLFRTVVLGFVVLSAAACATVDHSAAASLGTAGVQATQVLSAEAGSAVQTLGDLNKWWHVEGTLVCINVRPKLRQGCIDNVAQQAEDPSVPELAQIMDVLNKQKQAIDTLNKAYAAFVNLAQYNAGQEATAALKTSFADINSFLSAVSALPGATAAAPISSTLEKLTAGVVGLIADSRQNAQIRAANKDLGIANEALYEGLSGETTAMISILSQMKIESAALYQSAYGVGLISPMDVLTPVFAGAYPGIRLQPPSAASQDVVRAAAQIVVSLQQQQTSAAVAASHRAALATLQALQAQHAKLQSKQGINIAEIQAEVSNLKADVAQMTSTSAASTNK